MRRAVTALAVAGMLAAGLTACDDRRGECRSVGALSIERAAVVAAPPAPAVRAPVAPRVPAPIPPRPAPAQPAPKPQKQRTDPGHAPAPIIPFFPHNGGEC